MQGSDSRKNTLKISSQPSAKLLNDCGVTASFTPGTDSIFADNIFINFTNTSTNAQQITWFVNNLNHGSAQDLPFYFNGIGAYDIKLIAINGNCSDTMSITIMRTGTPTNDERFYNGSIGFQKNKEKSMTMTVGPGETTLMAGTTDHMGLYGDQSSNGMLVKQNKPGCIAWTKLLMNTLDIKQMITLKDSGYLVSGYDNHGSYLLRITKDGEPLWKKKYDAPGIPVGFAQFHEMQDGSIIGTNSAFSSGFIMLKLDPQGNLLWSRFLQYQPDVTDYTQTTAVFEWNSNLYVTGSVQLPSNDPNLVGAFGSFFVKVNPLNGEVILSKIYRALDGTRSCFIQDLRVHNNLLLSSTLNYNTLGGTNIFPGLQWMDADGNITKSFALKQSNFQMAFPTTVSAGVLPGNNIMMHFKGQQPISLQPGYINRNYFFKLNTADQLDWQLLKAGGQNDVIQMSRFNGEAMYTFGWGFFPTISQYWISENLVFTRLDSSGTSEGCINTSTDFSVQQHEAEAHVLNWAVNYIPVVTITSLDIQMADAYPEARSLCPDYIDSCALLTVKGPAAICDLNQTYTYKAGRNTKCAQPVEWLHEGPLTVINQTDSSITVQFQDYGPFKIAAMLRFSCTPRKDSMKVLAINYDKPLNLGADTSICAGNSLQLHASPYFYAYEWPDGSTDSLFTVLTPGSYWVKVTDSCGKQKTDTIHIALTSQVPISIGPDLEKCNGDSLVLTAPDGYLNYQWSNNYRINTLSGTEVIVYPDVDTAYYLKAEKTPGCFAFDTVRVTVHHSPAINLGLDTSICSGSQLSFDAGPGFESYAWNTGASAQQITTGNAGLYHVIATDQHGCKSYDTVRILNVWPLPEFSITGDSVICRNSQLTLGITMIPGASLTTWNTGVIGQSINVSVPGIYIATVLDGRGCVAEASKTVVDIVDPPADFLPADTMICSYGTLQLQAMSPYQDYLWNTGAVTPTLTISAPGLYWLEAGDEHCKGKDSIQVTLKECMKGLYVPSAFTPNNDGKNDLFRAMLFGNVKKFRFTVYNRWGQVVFDAVDPLKGWDGRVAGVFQGNHVFVWICSYQLEGEEAKVERGTVIVVR